MTLAIFLCLGVIFTWVALQPQKTLPPKPAPVVQITDAGSVKEIQLHETSLSTATTVTTTAGVYQVRGGVCRRFVAGFYDVPGCPLFVSRGAGTSVLPLRLGASAEVVVFDL